jgi:hypothetical protein
MYVKLIGYIKSEKPNNSLYTYDGLLVMNGPNGQKQVPLDPTQLLLRVSLISYSYVVHLRVLKILFSFFNVRAHN